MTLSELIKKCGDDEFVLYRRHNDKQWQAQCRITLDDKKPYPTEKTFIAFGTTPEEAVENLLKELNKK